MKLNGSQPVQYEGPLLTDPSPRDAVLPPWYTRRSYQSRIRSSPTESSRNSDIHSYYFDQGLDSISQSCVVSRFGVSLAHPMVVHPGSKMAVGRKNELPACVWRENY
jgi:hypothetical protein